MDIGLITQYATVGLVLIILQGLLSADNAMVMAVLVRPLPDDQRKKALFYGLIGALVLRFIAIFFASYLATIWELQALGAIYDKATSCQSCNDWEVEKRMPILKKPFAKTRFGTVSFQLIAGAIASDFISRSVRLNS